jgi:hypothetical protein
LNEQTLAKYHFLLPNIRIFAPRENESNMYKKISILIISCCWLLSIQAQQLSEKAEISLMTYDPLEELYGAYGHSSIHVFDPELRINYVYNYGTFDFDEPNFYMKFVRGKLKYKLSIQDYKGLISYSKRLNRTIREEVLNLSPAEKQRFFDLIHTNAQPENAYYLYDFFFDNCATRQRDLMVLTSADSLHFSASFIKEPQSFRALQKAFLQGSPWADFGVDLILGAKSDRIATPEERMYLPDELSLAFQNATITRNGKAAPLIKNSFFVMEAAPIVYENNFFTTPLFICWLLFFIVFIYTILTFKQEKNHRWFDHFWFIFMGIAGLVVALVWFGTDHKVTVDNWNLLWLHPFHLVAGIALFFAKARASWLKTYFKVLFVMTTLTLACWTIIPQNYHEAFMPLMLIFMVRSFYQMRRDA